MKSKIALVVARGENILGLGQMAHESTLLSVREITDSIDLTSKSSAAESAPEGKMTRPSVPLWQCWGHHGDGWRDDPGEEERGIKSAKQQSYITTASALEGVLHRHTDGCWFVEVLGVEVCV